MPTIDLRSILILAACMGFLMSVVLFFLRRSLPATIKGLDEWAAAPAIILVAMLLLAMRGAIHDVFSVVLGNLLLLVGCLLLLFGTQRFFGVATQKTLRIWLLFLAFAITTVRSKVEQNQLVR